MYYEDKVEVSPPLHYARDLVAKYRVQKLWWNRENMGGVLCVVSCCGIFLPANLDSICRFSDYRLQVAKLERLIKSSHELLAN